MSIKPVQSLGQDRYLLDSFSNFAKIAWIQNGRLQKIYEGCVDENYQPHGIGQFYTKEGGTRTILQEGCFESGTFQQTTSSVSSAAQSSFSSSSRSINTCGVQSTTHVSNGKLDLGDKTYEGEVENGRFHGKGTLTFLDGTKFIGTFKQGTLDGECNCSYSNGDSYEGKMQEGKFHGSGTLKLSDGTVYRGIFEDNSFLRGTIHYPDGFIYEGEVRDYKEHGTGKLTFPDKTEMSCPFENGLPEGEGICISSNGDRYEGMYQNGRKHGFGTLSYKNGDVRRGMFENGHFIQGIIYYADGGIYEGALKGNQYYSGPGRLKTSSGMELSGTFENGLLEGQGICKWPNGDKYEGMFQNGQMHGKGTFTYNNGTVYRGTFFKDGYFCQDSIKYPNIQYPNRSSYQGR